MLTCYTFSPTEDGATTFVLHSKPIYPIYTPHTWYGMYTLSFLECYTISDLPIIRSVVFAMMGPALLPPNITTEVNVGDKRKAAAQ